ncbi:vWA domain-containing protein [Streptomyces specialis]|uniref:vWA domain-containing protein n=1 Tax=Streptomyces specialis TaxID=498367 RepID=UPI00073F82A3|nr:VWA domain-containing protein [Streptomyces specialis]
MADFSKSHSPRFAVEVHQNPRLPRGAREVHAVVTVTATGSGGLPLPVEEPRAAVVLMVDCSGSMNRPPDKLRQTRLATEAAIGALRDGVAFAIVAGNHRAAEVFPGGGRLAVADDVTRAAARAAARGLTASGGTAIGTWLRLAARLFDSLPDRVTVRHGVLLTDGRDEHETPERLREALDACAGRFTCDARGVGTDWDPGEVTGIASALLGTADIVAEPEGLAADFTAMMTAATGKGVGDVALRLWTPHGASVVFLRQVSPGLEDLTSRRVESPPRSGDYPTGSWGDESREYHLCVRVEDAGVGRELLAARVGLVVREPGAPAAPPAAVPGRGHGLVRAVWTDDLAAATAVDPRVAHYAGQTEMVRAIREGLDLRRRGDTAGATARLGRAVRLAHLSGNEATAKLLAKVVDVDDAATGTVRLKARVSEADAMTLETRSTKTVRVKKPSEDE